MKINHTTLKLFNINWLYPCVLILIMNSCGDDLNLVPALSQSPSEPLSEGLSQAIEPRHIMVQHILIGFQGSIPGKKDVSRSKEESAALATYIMTQAMEGKDFNVLVSLYTDDSPPGLYRLANHGVPTAGDSFRRDKNSERERSGMVKSFGDVAFSLSKGELGLAEYDPKNCPYGWHIIKRIE